MSNLLEKLRELNNEEMIEVPANFRKKVIEEIESKKSNMSKIKYIISGVSIAAVAIFAITFANIGNKRLNNAECADNYEINNFFAQAESMMESDDLLADSSVLREDATSVNDLAPTVALNAGNKSQEYKDEIIKMLQLNKIEAQILNDGRIKAKAKKEDVEMVLYYYDGEIEIKQDGDYCYIKEM